MRKVLVVLALALCAVPLLIADSMQYDGMDGTAPTVSARRPLPTALGLNAGYLTGMATPTFTAHGDVAVRLPTLPAGTTVFAVTSIGGVTNFGGSNVASASLQEDYIASGATRYFDGIASTTPSYWFVGVGASTTCKVRPLGL